MNNNKRSDSSRHTINLIRSVFAIGLAAYSVWTPANPAIYLSETPDGLPYYSHTPSYSDSQPYLSLGDPPSRPLRIPRHTVHFAPSSSILHTYTGAQKFGIKNVVSTAARQYSIPEALLLAVIHAESNFNPMAVSRVGAIGLMQIMPQTGRRYGVIQGLADPLTNIDVGARYLKDLLILFKGDAQLTVAAYNAGEGAVIKYGRTIPPYKETKAYVPKVMQLYQKYISELSILASATVPDINQKKINNNLIY